MSLLDQMKNGTLNTALEEIGGVASPETETDENPVETIEEVGSEIEEENTQNDSDLQTYENLEGDANDMAHIEDTMQTALSNPKYEGMDEVGIEMLMSKINKFSTKYNIAIPVSLKTVAFEDFGVESECKREATQITLEAVEETNKSFGKKVVDGAIWLWNSFIEFLKSWFTKLGRVRKALNGMLKRIQGVKGSIKNETINAPKELQVCFNTAGDLNIEDVSKALQNQIKASLTSTAIIGDIQKATEDVASVLSSSKDNLNINMIAAIYDPLLKNLFGTKGEIGSSNEPLTNGKYLKFISKGREKTEQGKGNHAAADLKNYAIGFKVEATPVTPKEDAKLTVANKAQMIDASSMLFKALDGYDKLNGQFKKTDKELKELFKTMMPGNRFVDMDSAVIAMVNNFIRKQILVFNKMTRFLIGSSVDMIYGVVKYVELSIKEHDGEEVSEPIVDRQLLTN